MPAKTEKQRRFFIAELIKRQQGRKTSTGLSEKVIKEFIRKKKKWT